MKITIKVECDNLSDAKRIFELFGGKTGIEHRLLINYLPFANGAKKTLMGAGLYILSDVLSKTRSEILGICQGDKSMLSTIEVGLAELGLRLREG